MIVGRHPHVIVLAGPNGAGKSTSAPAILRGELRVAEFVNADVIARGLSAFQPENVAPEAGRLMLLKLESWRRTEKTSPSRRRSPVGASLRGCRC